MYVILAFVVLNCGTNFEKLGALVSVVLFTTFAIDVIPMCEGVCLLDLLS